MELWLRSKNEEKDQTKKCGRQNEKAHEKSFGGTDAIDSQLTGFAVPCGIFTMILFRLVPIFPDVVSQIIQILNLFKCVKFLLWIQSNIGPNDVEDTSANERIFDEKRIEKRCGFHDKFAQENVTATRNVARQFPQIRFFFTFHFDGSAKRFSQSIVHCSNFKMI